MSANNIILTGLPRSGTTLTCHLLNKLPDVVALHEPMDVFNFVNKEKRDLIHKDIELFYKATRRSIEKHKIAISKQVDGEVPDNPITDQHSTAGYRRKQIVSRGEIKIKKKLGKNYLLVIKHPSAFTALLNDLTIYFPCYAVIRNPLAVLASWNSVPFPVAEGHAPAAEQFDEELKNALSKIRDKTERQLYLLSWFFEKYQKVLPRSSIIRYEDIIKSGGEALNVIAPQAAGLAEVLASKNRNKVYDESRMRSLQEKLLKTQGAFWEFYSKDSVQELLQKNETTT